MSISVSWDNPQKTVIRYLVEGEWGWDDLQAANGEMNKLLETINHQANILLVLHNTSLVPNEVFSRFKRSMRTRHPRLGSVMVFVGAPRLVRMLTETFTRLYGRRAGLVFEFAETEEEGRRILAAAETRLQ